jgi:hypothetical protein
LVLGKFFPGILVGRLKNSIGFWDIQIEYKDISDYSANKLETPAEDNSAAEVQSDMLLEEQRKFMKHK